MSVSEGGSSNSTIRQPSTSRAVTAAESDTVSPVLTPLEQTHISNLRMQGSRHHSTGLSRRLSGRASVSSALSPDLSAYRSEQSGDYSPQVVQSYQELHGRLLFQLSQWLQHEKAKKTSTVLGTGITSSPLAHPALDNSAISPRQQPVDASKESDTDSALEKLESIIAENSDLARSLLGGSFANQHRSVPRRRSTQKARPRRLSHTVGSSDTEYFEGDALVPSADAVIDNKKTLGYSGGAASADSELTRTLSKSTKEENWTNFKNEIIRLTHTLRLKGWRRIPLGSGTEIDVQRLSGALTNAVYVVTPPERFKYGESTENKDTLEDHQKQVRRRPRKLLLRVYGPQVEHLIDREAELQILKRLARKNIGPRLLGTFENGRFEEYLNATTLTPEDLRNPKTSKQIAKRMRELHDGIELLSRERNVGPNIWRNWDKWVSRCGEVISWLDEQILANQEPVAPAQSWKSRGLVCGVEWTKFRRAVEMYRKWLTRQYGGEQRIRDILVFAHNDTQYANLLRLEPTGESPLLLPANEHRQLVVIDFEYANANPPGLEFANHFTEWCYNYHSTNNAHVCNESGYPTPKEQKRFLKAYLQHVPRQASPQLQPLLRKSTSSISSFMLDSRGPPGQYDTEEAAREEQWNKEVDRLMKETRLWRVANSAQWVAWGIVQAKMPGMEEALRARRTKPGIQSDELSASASNKREGKEDGLTKAGSSEDLASDVKMTDSNSDTEQESEFDYLAYAQQRAFFFWGDLLELGLIKDEDLPDPVRAQVKRVPY